MMMDSGILIQMIFRWLHFVFGILWIGHLYFFNFVNATFQSRLDAPTKQKVVPELMPRALWWFRWGAMVTFLTGYLMIYWRYWVSSDAGMTGFMASSYGQWISLGATFGTIMWFNVWFVIWPIQKGVIKAVAAGEKPDAAKVERARKASKLNTFLSIPLLFSMGAASHFPVSGWLWQVIVVALGFLIAQTFYKLAPKVGKLN